MTRHDKSEPMRYEIYQDRVGKTMLCVCDVPVAVVCVCGFMAIITLNDWKSPFPLRSLTQTLCDGERERGRDHSQTHSLMLELFLH